jgi:hypothetical protein
MNTSEMQIHQEPKLDTASRTANPIDSCMNGSSRLESFELLKEYKSTEATNSCQTQMPAKQKVEIRAQMLQSKVSRNLRNMIGRSVQLMKE